MKRFLRFAMVLMIGGCLSTVTLAQSSTPSAADEATAMELFLRAEESKSVSLMSTIIQVYPGSKAAIFAEARIAELEKAPQPITETPTKTVKKRVSSCDGFETNGVCLDSTRSLTMYVQETLSDLGCPVGRPDGQWGKRTSSAMAAANRSLGTDFEKTRNVYSLTEIASALSGLNEEICSCGSNETLSSRGNCVCKSGYSRSSTGSCRKKAVSSSSSGGSCFDLWYARNAIFDRNGYCFKTAKGKRHFNNGDCYTSSQSLSSSDRARVNAIRRQERANGC